LNTVYARIRAARREFARVSTRYSNRATHESTTTSCLRMHARCSPQRATPTTRLQATGHGSQLHWGRSWRRSASRRHCSLRHRSQLAPPGSGGAGVHGCWCGSAAIACGWRARAMPARCRAPPASAPVQLRPVPGRLQPGRRRRALRRATRVHAEAARRRRSCVAPVAVARRPRRANSRRARADARVHRIQVSARARAASLGRAHSVRARGS